MITIKQAHEFITSLEDVVEAPHFHKNSYRVKKKIFATLDEKENTVCVCLSAVDQSAFSAYDKDVIAPIQNAWGKQGWTNINLKKVPKEMFRDAVVTAYNFIIAKTEQQKAARKKKK